MATVTRQTYDEYSLFSKEPRKVEMETIIRTTDEVVGLGISEMTPHGFLIDGRPAAGFGHNAIIIDGRHYYYNSHEHVWYSTYRV